MVEYGVHEKPISRRDGKPRMSIAERCGGTQFGMLELIGAVDRKRPNGRSVDRVAVCKCACGTNREFQVHALKAGHHFSCGCQPKRRGHLRKTIQELCGKTIAGHLTVIGEEDIPEEKRGKSHQTRMAICKCVCGNIVKRQPDHIKKGMHNSCGCKPHVPRGHNKRHGDTNSPTWNSWQSMHQRCNAKSGQSKTYYVDKGVKVCDRWYLYENFLEDMGKRPKGKTLDRWPNGAGNYEPGNCRWATIKEQNENRSSTVWIEVNGKNYVCSEFSKHGMLDAWQVSKMVKAGMSGLDIIDRAIEALEKLKNT